MPTILKRHNLSTNVFSNDTLHVWFRDCMCSQSQLEYKTTFFSVKNRPKEQESCIWLDYFYTFVTFSI